MEVSFKCSLTELTTRSNCSQLLSVVLLYLCMRCIPCALHGTVLFIGVAGRRSSLCGNVSGISLPPSPSLLSTVYQCDGCLSSRGCGGSWLVCQVLPAIGAVSVVVLAAKSGSSRMAQAPNAHLTTHLLITLTIIHININLIQWLPNPL